MLKSREGQNVPQVTFRTRRDHERVDVSSDEIFKGKTVVVFSLPGAFTPTCSSTHVPRYNQLVPAFRQHGVDDVVCISVNDAFVMNEWRSEQKAFNVTFMPDGNGDFSRGMGMLVPKNDLGFGERSWRYSMLVKDGVIERMFIEPDVPGDPFEVSDADTMLRLRRTGCCQTPGRHRIHARRLRILRACQGHAERCRCSVRGTVAEPRFQRGDDTRGLRRFDGAAGFC